MNSREVVKAYESMLEQLDLERKNISEDVYQILKEAIMKNMQKVSGK